MTAATMSVVDERGVSGGGAPGEDSRACALAEDFRPIAAILLRAHASAARRAAWYRTGGAGRHATSLPRLGHGLCRVGHDLSRDPHRARIDPADADGGVSVDRRRQHPGRRPAAARGTPAGAARLARVDHPWHFVARLW